MNKVLRTKTFNELVKGDIVIQKNWRGVIPCHVVIDGHTYTAEYVEQPKRCIVTKSDNWHNCGPAKHRLIFIDNDGYALPIADATKTENDKYKIETLTDAPLHMTDDDFVDAMSHIHDDFANGNINDILLTWGRIHIDDIADIAVDKDNNVRIVTQYHAGTESKTILLTVDTLVAINYRKDTNAEPCGVYRAATHICLT